MKIVEYGQCRLWRDALEYFDGAQTQQKYLKLTRTHTHTNQIVYGATIDVCGKGKQWITATTLLREMQQWHMKLGTITYVIASAVCRPDLGNTDFRSA